MSGGELEKLMVLIEQNFPLEKRFRRNLPQDVARLSRLLTYEREEREDGYMGRAALLGAYLRYFLPWNIYRLSRILPELPLSLKDGDSLLDLGSGPLTFPLALWLYRGEFRSRVLEFRCLDRNGRALEAGLTLFRALAGDSPWSIKKLRSSIGERVPGKKAALVSAIGVYNEVFQHERRSFGEFAEKQAALLSALAADNGAIFIAEPGIPQSGALISAFRSALIRRFRLPLSPCVHSGPCPFPGNAAGRSARKEKWCHFAFDTGDAPAPLRDLSLEAGLPKDRAVLSFLYSGAISRAVSPAVSGAVSRDESSRTGGTDTGHSYPVRVISDAFTLEGGRRGRYGCSGQGMVLVNGSSRSMEACPSGSLITALPPNPPERDKKSGALLVKPSEGVM
ncbi:MAG: rRNA methyltransferase [Spirochaetaceae bacterium]|jgi:hypothetical protein|nr:rRNA methyltransferase [Spirochaetaceae bacterium]